MRCIFLLLYICGISTITTIAQTEINYNLDSIIVTANRVPINIFRNWAEALKL